MVPLQKPQTPVNAADYDSGFDYVYQYKDIWNNVRLSYSDLDGNGSINPNTEILREQNYYPGGLEHKGYNNVIQGVKNNLKQYQGQEFTEDLGLNTHEWKYRVSDPAILRFWQIDPLAEDYVYNSTYAFQENKLGMGIELEGAELLGWEQLAIADAAARPNGVGAHTIGVAQGLTNTVTGIWDAVTNPVQTLKGLGNMMVAGAAQGNPVMMLQADAVLGTDSFGTSAAMSQALDGAVNDVVSGNGIERGTVIGEVIGAVVGTKGTNVALKGVTKMLPKGSKSVFTPKDANGVTLKTTKTKAGNTKIDAEARGRAHTQLRVDKTGNYPQRTTFDSKGRKRADTHYTTHGEKNKSNPHKHTYYKDGRRNKNGN